MTYREPLTPPILHVADPPTLPVRRFGDPSPQPVARALDPVVTDGTLSLRAILQDESELALSLDAAAPGVVRLCLGPEPGTRPRVEQVTRLVHAPGDPNAEWTASDEGWRLRTGGLHAEVGLDPWTLRFVDDDGRLLVEANGTETDISFRLRVLPLGRSAAADGRTLAFHECFTARPDEHYFGLGEKFTGFDKRGQRIVSWNYDAFSTESERSYKNVPFFLSTRGYGVLVNSGAATEFDLCAATHACAQIVVPDDMLEYYLIGGPRPADVVERYHRLTGQPVAPPAWALGTWISTGYFRGNDQARTLEIAHMIRRRGIPADVLHLDAYWQRRGRWSDLAWDTDKFPDPEAMLAELADLGFHVSVWMNPYISVDSPLYDDAAAAGRFLTRLDGSPYAADCWHGNHEPCGIVDFTDPDTVAWYQSLLRPLLKQGVSVFKTDFGEGVPVDARTPAGVTGTDLHNVYALLFNDAVADVTEEVHGHRVVWARSSFTGGQRHCAQWAGDSNATWTAMASTLRGGLSYAASGVPYWSHDAGGFTGTPSPELFIRSSQFAAFSPLARFHGTSSRLPWDYGPEVEAAIADALRQRYRLMPYLYTAAVEAARSGHPIIRPLFFEAPGEPGTWAADLEYLFGPDLLTAPVTDPEGERQVYLPEGQWIEYETGRVHSGRTHVAVVAALTELPLFVRMNSLIARCEAQADTAEAALRASLTLDCWGGGDAFTVVHGLDGETAIRLRRDTGTADLAVSGAAVIERVRFPHVEGVARPDRVLINGVPAQGADAGSAWTPA